MSQAQHEAEVAQLVTDASDAAMTNVRAHEARAASPASHTKGKSLAPPPRPENDFYYNDEEEEEEEEEHDDDLYGCERGARDGGEGGGMERAGVSSEGPPANQQEARLEQKLDLLRNQREREIRLYDLRQEQREHHFSSQQQVPGPGLGAMVRTLRDSSKTARGISVGYLPGQLGGIRRLACDSGGGKEHEFLLTMDVAYQGGIFGDITTTSGPPAFPCTTAAIQASFELQRRELESTSHDGQGELSSENKMSMLLVLLAAENHFQAAVRSYAETGTSTRALKGQWIFNSAVIGVFHLFVLNTMSCDVIHRNVIPDDMPTVIKTAWRTRFLPLLVTEANGTLSHLDWSTLRDAAALVLPGCPNCGRSGQTESTCFACLASRATSGQRNPAFETAYYKAKDKDVSLTRAAFASSDAGKALSSQPTAVKAVTEQAYFESLLASQARIPVPVCGRHV